MAQVLKLSWINPLTQGWPNNIYYDTNEDFQAGNMGDKGNVDAAHYADIVSSFLTLDWYVFDGGFFNNGSIKI